MKIKTMILIDRQDALDSIKTIDTTEYNTLELHRLILYSLQALPRYEIKHEVEK